MPPCCRAWSTASSRAGRRCSSRSRIGSCAPRCRATPAEAVKAEADRVVADAKTESDKLTKLYAFVAHDIRSVDVPLGEAGYEPNAPELVLKNKYADQRDKVGLLLAMAAAEGIARPARCSCARARSGDRERADDRAVRSHRREARPPTAKTSGSIPMTSTASTASSRTARTTSCCRSRRAAASSASARRSIRRRRVAKQSIKYVLAANGDLDDRSPGRGDRHVRRRSCRKSCVRSRARTSTSWFQQQAAGDVGRRRRQGPSGRRHEQRHRRDRRSAQKVAVPGYSQAQGTFRVLELPSMALGMETCRRRGLSERKLPLLIGSPRTEQGEISVQIPCGLEGRVRAAEARGRRRGCEVHVGVHRRGSDRHVQGRDHDGQARRADRQVPRAPRRDGEARRRTSAASCCSSKG